MSPTSRTALIVASVPGRALTLAAVRTHTQFGEEINPCGEHDMGRCTVNGEDYYWKIDYYDRNLEFHSPDPADPSAAICAHNSLDGDIPPEITGETTSRRADLNLFQRKTRCRGLYQLPVPA